MHPYYFIINWTKTRVNKFKDNYDRAPWTVRTLCKMQAFIGSAWHRPFIDLTLGWVQEWVYGKSYFLTFLIEGPYRPLSRRSLKRNIIDLWNLRMAINNIAIQRFQKSINFVSAISRCMVLHPTPVTMQYIESHLLYIIYIYIYIYIYM